MENNAGREAPERSWKLEMSHFFQGHLNSQSCIRCGTMRMKSSKPPSERSHELHMFHVFYRSAKGVRHQCGSECVIKPGVTNIQSRPSMRRCIRTVSAYITSMFSPGFPQSEMNACLHLIQHVDLLSYWAFAVDYRYVGIFHSISAREQMCRLSLALRNSPSHT